MRAKKKSLPPMNYGDVSLMTDGGITGTDVEEKREAAKKRRGPFRGRRGLLAFIMVGQGHGVGTSGMGSSGTI